MENISQPSPVELKRKISRKALLATGLVSAVVILVLGYFLALPAVQVNEYKKDAESKHRQVNDKMLRVYDSFKRGAFTSTDTTADKAKLDVRVAKDAVKDAENTLNANAAAMTEFSAWPLLAWNDAYKQATDTDAAEEKYVKQSREFLQEYSALLNYTDKSADIGVKMEAAIKDLEKRDGETEPADMVKVIDASVAKIKPLADEHKAIAPPAYLKADAEVSDQIISRLIAALQDMSAGVKNLDLDKIEKANSDIMKEVSTIEEASKASVDALQNKSPIQSQINKLRDLDASIIGGYAKL